MFFQSARIVRAGWISAACWVCVVASQPAAVRGQEASGPPQVEMWRGNSRIGADAAPAAPRVLEPVAAPPSSTLEPLGQPLPGLASDSLSARPALAPLPPIPDPPVIRVASSQPAGPTDESRKLAELSRDLIRSTTGLASKCQTALDNARSSLLNTGDSLVESLNPTPRRYSPERPQPTTVVVTQPSPDRAASDDLARASEAMPWYQIVWLQIAIGGGAIVVTPLMLALVLGIMLRRSGLQFRVEVVNSVPGTGIAFGVTRLDDATARPVGHLDATDPNRPGHLAAPPDDTPDELPSTAQPFDLGPTYEEERAAREDAVQLQEQALLQEVFEQNLRLRDELAQLDGPPAAAAAPVDLMALAAAESAEEDIVVEPIGYVTEDHEQGI